MVIPFVKYHALENDFVVVDRARVRLAASRWPTLAQQVCHRRSGVGADGLLVVSADRSVDARLDVYNADGSWAEKSGNGLRIAAAFLRDRGDRRRSFRFRTGAGIDRVRVLGSKGKATRASAELGHPDFRAAAIPVRTRRRAIINAPLRLGGIELPVTCVSVGNPHAVLVVADFDFDWQQVGADIERHRAFPQGTNVGFVRVVGRRRLEVREWERGAGPTGSSGTGAAAAVAAAVMLGLSERRCAVVYPAGTLNVHWRSTDDVIEVSGPVTRVCSGEYLFA